MDIIRKQKPSKRKRIEYPPSMSEVSPSIANKIRDGYNHGNLQEKERILDYLRRLCIVHDLLTPLAFYKVSQFPS